ncbi:hypothetical protein A4X13_0g4893 [Tilletia indica]|uniref:Uncharacterized protein n=1 Tax=Tilletia indica TaxID=43049 RepID=A0A177TNM1_9BASI|nr:hypothetical protein A4X13_0g4893 [Tilletia indica]
MSQLQQLPPTPRSFDRFPGEVVLSILRNYLETQPRDHQSLKALVAATVPFQLLSRKFKLAIDVIIGLHLHTYPVARHQGTHSHLAPWHVGAEDGILPHRDYWGFFQGRGASDIPVFSEIISTLTVPRIPTLRSVSLDLRTFYPMTKSSLRLWQSVHAPRWVKTSMILTQISTGSRAVEELNLRITAQQDLIDIVQDIVDRNKRLRVIRIEIDSTFVPDGGIRPIIRLDHMFGCYKSRVPLERLVIRAPSCDIKMWSTSGEQQGRFFKHLSVVKEVVIACHVFKTLLPTMIWTYHLLRHMPKLEEGDIAVHIPDTHKMTMADAELPILHMHALEKLSLQIPEVDTHVLRSINALSLFKLRIKSAVPIEDWPICVENHFPNLFIANILCPGPSALRLQALGVQRRWSYHNFGSMHNETRYHHQSFLAFIKPYSRRRFEHPRPPPSDEQPYRLIEACEMGWDEMESEEDVTTISELSDSEDSTSELSSLTELSDTEASDSPTDSTMDWDSDEDALDQDIQPVDTTLNPAVDPSLSTEIEPSQELLEETGEEHVEPISSPSVPSVVSSLFTQMVPTPDPHEEPVPAQGPVVATDEDNEVPGVASTSMTPAAESSRPCKRARLSGP